MHVLVLTIEWSYYVHGTNTIIISKRQFPICSYFYANITIILVYVHDLSPTQDLKFFRLLSDLLSRQVAATVDQYQML